MLDRAAKVTGHASERGLAPKALLKEVEGQYDMLCENLKSKVWEEVNGKGSVDFVETGTADQLRSLYELQLMGDSLRESVYGRSDVSPSDMLKIDSIREGKSLPTVSGTRTRPRPEN